MRYIKIMRDSLKDSKASSGLAAIIKAANAQGTGEGERPVEKWDPKHCGKMDMVIRRDGTWWHEGSPIGRKALVELFASVLRKDEDGKTYLVTPVEKIEIQVECAHFLVVDLKRDGNNYYFTTNLGETVKLSTERPLRVLTDPETLEPTPLLRVRGRLDALLTRAVFFELIEHAIEQDTDEGQQLGIKSGDAFFPIAPAGAHL